MAVLRPSGSFLQASVIHVVLAVIKVALLHRQVKLVSVEQTPGSTLMHGLAQDGN